MYLSRAKTSLLQTKSNARLTFAIKKTDIIQIVKEAWGKSFAHVETNCKAITEHGWGPLNYSCLTNPKIQQKTMATGNDVMHVPLPAQLEPLNLMNGIMGILINKIDDLTNQD